MAGRPPSNRRDAGTRLASVLRGLRVDQDLQRSALARRSSISVNTIMAVEQGRVADPGFFTVAALARALAVGLDDLLRRVRESSNEQETPMSYGIVSVGYEGRTVEELVADLQRLGVTHLVDVRLTPLSRRAGFSKRGLAAALREAGISYRHMRTLGNPPDNRANFQRGPFEVGRRNFRRLLEREEAEGELGELLGLAERAVVAVLCVERDEERCHRKVIVDQLREARVALPVAALA